MRIQNWLRRLKQTRTRTRHTQTHQSATEALETRVLPATINWVNQAQSQLTPQAEAVVEHAIADWEAAIIDMNDADGDNTFNVTINFTDLGIPGRLGQASQYVTDADGVPQSALIEIDDNAGGTAWYIDPAPSDDGEFGVMWGPFAAWNGGSSRDLYTTVAHELGHVLGFDDQFDRFDALIVNDLFVGPTAIAVMNPDGGHLDNAFHPNTLLDVGRVPGTRELVSDLELDMLADAYGYTVLDRADVDSMYVVHNDPTGEVLVRGLVGNDDIDVHLLNPDTVDVYVAGIAESYGREPGESATAVTVLGGGGNDTIEALFWSSPLAPTLIVDGGSGDDTLETVGNFPNLATLVGGSGNDTLTGLDTEMYGGSGNDVLSGVGAPLFGGSGNDTLTGSLVYGEDGDDVLTASVAYGGDGADSITGNSGANTLDGGAGDDTIIAGDGDDEIHGGDGADSIEGGGHNDTIYGDAGNDSIWGNDGHDHLWGGVDDDEIRGQNGNDQIYGQGGLDSLWGASGNDNIRGNGDHDVLYGSSGRDTLRGGSGNDSLLGGIGDDFMEGNGGNDTLSGNKGSDHLDGGGGNDLLIAGTLTQDGYNGDSLFGGSGNDTAQGLLDFTDLLDSIETDQRLGGGI